MPLLRACWQLIKALDNYAAAWVVDRLNRYAEALERYAKGEKDGNGQSE